MVPTGVWPLAVSVAHVARVHEVTLGWTKLGVRLESALVGVFNDARPLPQLHASIDRHEGRGAALELAPLAASPEELEEECADLCVTQRTRAPCGGWGWRHRGYRRPHLGHLGEKSRCQQLDPAPPTLIVALGDSAFTGGFPKKTLAG